MIKAIFIFMSILLVGTLPVVAADECKAPFTELIEAINKEYPASSNRAMNSKQTETFLIAYNYLAPRSNFKSDTVVMFSKPDEPQALFVFVKDFCVETLTTMSYKEFMFMMQGGRLE